MSNTQRPRIFIEVSGGNIQAIASDMDVDVVIVDWDNVDAEDIGPEDVERHLSPELTSGNPSEVDDCLARARVDLEDKIEVADEEVEAVAPRP